MFETKQMMVAKMATGRRPNDVWMGTLCRLAKNSVIAAFMNTPYEVTKAQNQDADARKLDCACQIRVERLDQIWKHGRQSKRSESLCESHNDDHGHRGELPKAIPILTILLRGGR